MPSERLGFSVHISELYRNIDSTYFSKTATFDLIVCHLLKKSDVAFFAALIESVSLCFICDALHDLAPFVQFEKHPWKSDTFPPWVFLTILKLYKW